MENYFLSSYRTISDLIYSPINTLKVELKFFYIFLLKSPLRRTSLLILLIILGDETFFWKIIEAEARIFI